MLTKDECHIDFETRSAIELRNVGLFVYAKHKTTSPWCAAYAFDDEEPELWLPGEEIPERLHDHIVRGGILYAHNAQFERTIFREIMGPRFDWPQPDLEQWRCTMAMAYAMALPGSLEGAGAAVNLNIQKDKEGGKVMKKMAKPRRRDLCLFCEGYDPECSACYGLGVVYTWWDSDANKQILYSYCKNDVVVERDLEKRLLPLSPTEQKIWFLDQQINERGVYIDKELCEKANDIVYSAQSRLDAEMKFATKGKVDSCSAASALMRWLKENDVDAPNLRRETVDEILSVWDIDEIVRKALTIRAEGSKVSVAKIKKMILMRGEDGRARGHSQYHGADTGRWAARGIQLQNLKRSLIKMVAEAIQNILDGCSPEWLEFMYGPPLSVVSDCIRGMITAAPGAQLIAADLSNIEGRGVAWLADEKSKLRAFKAFDEGTGPDIYLVAAKGIFGREIDADDPLRQIGKVSELSLGYQGGPIAFSKMAGNYGLRIADYYDIIWAAADSRHKEMASKSWETRGSKSPMSAEGWKAADVIKIAWRESNPRIVGYWEELENAALAAVQCPGEAFEAGRCAFKVNGSFLWCRLPSGRVLCYPYPRIIQQVWFNDGDESYTVSAQEGREMERRGSGTVEGRAKPKLICKSLDDKGGFKPKALYGGLLCENVTQAIARDVMAEAMLRIDAAGYPIVLTVHDEIVAEKKNVTQADVDHFNELMMTMPKWAAGYPISAKAWTGQRYKK